jgi:hypothetical protein
MTNSANPSPIFATPTRARAETIARVVRTHALKRIPVSPSTWAALLDDMSTHLAQPSEFRARYRLGGPGTTVLHLSARDFTDLGLTPGARTIHLFGATFTRLETI